MILPLVQTIPASGQERVNIENTKWEAENQKAIWRSAVGTNQLMIIHLFVTMLSQPRVGALLLCVLLCVGLLVAFLLVDGTPDTQNTPDIPDTADEKYGGGDSYPCLSFLSFFVIYPEFKKIMFLAVQDSSIGDLVTHSVSYSVSHSMSELTFDISVVRTLQSCCRHIDFF